jgi:two-component system, LytTR family, sensor kinase
MVQISTAAGVLPALQMAAPYVEPPLTTRELRAAVPVLHWRHALYVLGAWTLVGLFNTEQAYVAAVSAGRHTEWLTIFRAIMPGMMMWAVFTPAVVAITRRFPFDRHNWPRAVPVHILGAILGGLGDATLYHFIDPWVNPNPAPNIFAGFVRYIDLNIVDYFMVVAVTLFVGYSRLLRERQVAAVELSSQLTAAHLRELQAQLRPHFLFNTLNTVAELVHQDPEAADRMITQLAALLRRSLDSFGDQEIALRNELEFLTDYVEIIKVRFRGRITVTTDIEQQALSASVPTLILQPIVENAVRHGLEPRAVGGHVEVTAWTHGDTLTLEVQDDGVGLSLSPRNGHSTASGVGLQNTADRLRHLYGNAASLTVSPRAGGGTTVSIAIPFRKSSREEAMPA